MRIKVQWRWSCVSKAHNKTILATGYRATAKNNWISHFVNSNRIRKSKEWTQEKINSPKPVNILANVFADRESVIGGRSLSHFFACCWLQGIWLRIAHYFGRCIRCRFLCTSDAVCSGFIHFLVWVCQLGWYFLLFTSSGRQRPLVYGNDGVSLITKSLSAPPCVAEKTNSRVAVPAASGARKSSWLLGL
jgi:hypothetical protein